MNQEESVFSDAVSRAVLVSAPEGILVVNREGQIVLVNSQTEKLFRYGPNELVGLHFEALLPEAFREEHQRQISGFMDSPEQRPCRGELELRAVRKDGMELFLEMSVGAVELQGGLLLCCVLRKVPSPRPSGQEISETAERFRLMVENSHDILCIRNADGKVRYASPSIERIMGYKQEEMIGSTGFELLHPEDRSNVENALNKFWKRPGARDSIQYRARHANGSWVSLEVVAHNLLDDPDVRGVVLNGRDISERKREETQLEELIVELQEGAAKLAPLTGFLLICASCKNIKNELGIWQRIEEFIRKRTPVEFSHGMCPECAAYWYPEFHNKK
jgi:PAS domain S-box-containing protein